MDDSTLIDCADEEGLREIRRSAALASSGGESYVCRAHWVGKRALRARKSELLILF